MGAGNATAAWTVLDVFVDHNVVELFFNDGEVSQRCHVFRCEPFAELKLIHCAATRIICLQATHTTALAAAPTNTSANIHASGIGNTSSVVFFSGTSWGMQAI